MSKPHYNRTDDESKGIFREAAIEAAKRGWFVLPLHGIVTDGEGNLVCDCGKRADDDDSDCTPGKHPYLFHGFKDASNTPHVVESWWKQWPNANPGVVVGHEFVVIDLDPRNGSDESLSRLVAEHGPLPHTLVADTGGGGTHHFFQRPEGYSFDNSPPAMNGYEGIDIKAKEGYVVMAPSLHESGRNYSWRTSPDTPMAALPEWMLEGVEEDKPAGERIDGLTSWAWSALEGECRKVREARKGARNDTLFKAAHNIGQIVAGGSLPWKDAEDKLLGAALASELPRPESLRTIDSGFTKGKENPRTAPRLIDSREGALRAVEEIHRLIRLSTWPGHQGTRMRAYLEAMVNRARTFGGPRNIPATIMQIAIESGMSYGTMHKAQGECMNEGWVSRRRRGYEGVPSRWDIRIAQSPDAFKRRGGLLLTSGGSSKEAGRTEDGMFSSDTQVIHDLCNSGSYLPNEHRAVPIGHDAFASHTHRMTEYGWRTHTKGLDKSAWHVMQYLLDEGGWRTQSQIVQATGKSRTTIWKVVGKKLLPHGLIEKGPHGVRALSVTLEDLDEVALELKTNGYKEKRLRMYQEQRKHLGNRLNQTGSEEARTIP